MSQWTFGQDSSMDFGNPAFTFDGSVSAAPLGSFQSAAPQDMGRNLAKELVGYALVFSAAVTPPTGYVSPALYTFGTHAAAIYNAEAVKSKIQQSVSAAPQGALIPPALYTFGTHAAAIYNAEAVKSKIQQSVSAAPQGALIPYHSPDVFDQTQPAPQMFCIARSQTAAAWILGAYSSTAEQRQDRPTISVWNASTTQSKMLGMFTWTAPQSFDFTTQAVFSKPLIGVGSHGILGTYTVTAPQIDFTLQSSYSAPVVGLVAPTNKLGAYIVTLPQVDLTVQPVFDAPPMHLPFGTIVSYHNAIGQDTTQPSALKFGISNLSQSGVLGAYTIALEQIQDRPIKAIWPSIALGVGLPGILGTTHIVQQQLVDLTLQAWFKSSVPAQPDPLTASTYGWTMIIALSQAGVQGAQSVFVQNSACLVQATYYNLLNVPFVPAAVQYRVDDILSGENIVPWTSIAPAATNTVQITSAQNAMISFTRAWEQHQVLFQVTDGSGNIYFADVIYYVLRVAGAIP